MLKGVRIFSTDKVWRQILADFGATVTDVLAVTDVNFDELKISDVVNPMQLKAVILAATDGRQALSDVFGRHVILPQLQARIVGLLHKTGGMTYSDLRFALGMMPDTTSHAIDTAIYQLRQRFGREFIKNVDLENKKIYVENIEGLII